MLGAMPCRRRQNGFLPRSARVVVPWVAGLAVFLSVSATPTRADEALRPGFAGLRLAPAAATGAVTLRVGVGGGFGHVAARPAWQGQVVLGADIPLAADWTLGLQVRQTEASRGIARLRAWGDSNLHVHWSGLPVTLAAGLMLWTADGLDGLRAASPWLGAAWSRAGWTLQASAWGDRSQDLPMSRLARWAQSAEPGWHLRPSVARSLGDLSLELAWSLGLDPDGALRDRPQLDLRWPFEVGFARFGLGAWFETPGIRAPDGRDWLLGGRLEVRLPLRRLARELFPRAEEAPPAFDPFG